MNPRLPVFPNIPKTAKRLVTEAGRAYNWLDGGGSDRTVTIGGRKSKLTRMELPWGPGGNSQFLKALAKLRQTGHMDPTPLANTGVSLKSVDWRNYHGDEVVKTYSGNDKPVSAMLRDLFLDEGDEKAHMLQLIRNDAVHKKGPVHPADLLGSMVSSSHKGYGGGTLHQGYIHPSLQGKGIYGETLKARQAQMANHLGFNPAIGGYFSNPALVALRSALKKQTIKPDFQMIDQIISHAADVSAPTRGGRLALLKYQEALAKKEPRGLSRNPHRVAAVPPKLVDRTLKLLDIHSPAGKKLAELQKYGPR